MGILNNIISIMTLKKISQKELTDYLGVQNTVFTKWKAGTSTSYYKYMPKIAEFLNVSTDYLLENEQKEKALSAETEKALSMFDKLNSDDKQLILEMMRKLVK